MRLEYFQDILLKKKDVILYYTFYIPSFPSKLVGQLIKLII